VDRLTLPLGISLSSDIEVRVGRATPFRARVRWVDAVTKKRSSKSQAFDTRDAAVDWVTRMERAAARGVDPNTATTTLSDYGQTNMRSRCEASKQRRPTHTWPVGGNVSSPPWGTCP
jgi:hypothetical protein